MLEKQPELSVRQLQLRAQSSALAELRAEGIHVCPPGRPTFFSRTGRPSRASRRGGFQPTSTGRSNGRPQRRLRPAPFVQENAKNNQNHTENRWFLFEVLTESAPLSSVFGQFQTAQCWIDTGSQVGRTNLEGAF